MSKNLITGGLGYMGTNLARHLLNKGEEVVVFDIVNNSPLIQDIKDKIKIIQGQLGNWAEVLNVVHDNNIDCIYHLGAMITIPAEANPWAAYNTNVNGTYNILEAARLFNIKSVIWPSGIANYSLGIGEVVDEYTFQSNPSQIYAATKIFGERLGEYYHHKFGVNFRSPSFPAICGPGRRKGLAAYASLMIQEAIKKRSISLPIDKESQMPFIYIKDVIRCLVSLKEVNEDKLNRRVYSIQGFSLTAGEMAKIVQKYILDAKIKFLADEKIVKLVEGMPTKVNDARARKDWGWKAKYNWEETIKDFIAEVKSNPNLYQ